MFNFFDPRPLNTAPEILELLERVAVLEGRLQWLTGGTEEELLTNYAQRVIAAGGTISDATLTALAALITTGQGGEEPWLNADTQSFWLMTGDSNALSIPLVGQAVELFGSFSGNQGVGLKPDSLSLDNYADLGVNLAGQTRLTIAVNVLEKGSRALQAGMFVGAVGSTYLMGSNYYNGGEQILFALQSEDQLVFTEAVGLLVATYDGETKSVYKNGQMLQSSSEPGKVVSQGDFLAWKLEDFGGLASDDRIGFIGIWAETLSSNQVASLYQAVGNFDLTIGRG